MTRNSSAGWQAAPAAGHGLQPFCGGQKSRRRSRNGI